MLTPLCRYCYYLQHTYHMQLQELNKKGARAKILTQAIFYTSRSNIWGDTGFMLKSSANGSTHIHTSQLRCVLWPAINYKHVWHPFTSIIHTYILVWKYLVWGQPSWILGYLEVFTFDWSKFHCKTHTQGVGVQTLTLSEPKMSAE